MPSCADPQAHAFAERVRAACLQAALDAYEEAALRGLCAEGALEYALDAIRRLDLVPLCPASFKSGNAGCEPPDDPVG
ncbi:hypothetical protein BJI67_11110 [Acidihalobacter aeolianus]|uniref:Acetyltransferase n=1 Tax=Acidihalobacter aeolianus TaxID=2792603 RepID=A0A1D8K984_9GAMM|nr:hypothetical protein [Acidihalobacter aeolianus]AOV17538.1 hypothetical protein BJI67_11110 [Acidihalobacter aeolianus]